MRRIFQPKHKKRASCTQPTQHSIFNQRFRLALFADDDCKKDITSATKYDAKYAKIYLNTKYQKDTEHQNVCEELANLLEYVETSVVKDSFTEKVDCQVKNVNKTEGDFLMTLHEKLQAERAEGIEQEKIATVIRMAKKNMPLSDIAECTDLSTDEVQKILNTIAK